MCSVCSSLLPCRSISSQQISCWSLGIHHFRLRDSSVVLCSECTNLPYCIRCSCCGYGAREIDRSCPKSINGCVWRWACKDMARKPQSCVGYAIPCGAEQGFAGDGEQ